jgi:hypothetical protein
MKNKSTHILVAFLLLFVTFSEAQRYRIQNGIGVFGGITQFDIDTDNFVTKSNNGWQGGFAATVDLPHRWYNISYNIQLAENKLDFSAAPIANDANEFVEHKVFTAQIALLGHIKLIQNYLTIDAGPMIQYNSQLDLKDDSKENYILEGYTDLTLGAIKDVSKLNINGAVGISAGVDNFRVRAQYIYGFTNIFNNLNKSNLSSVNDTDFKGNQSMIVFSAMFGF